MPRLNEDLAIAHGSGRYVRLLAQRAKTDVLLMDDYAMAPMRRCLRGRVIGLRPRSNVRRLRSPGTGTTSTTSAATSGTPAWPVESTSASTRSSKGGFVATQPADDRRARPDQCAESSATNAAAPVAKRDKVTERRDALALEPPSHAWAEPGTDRIIGMRRQRRELCGLGHHAERHRGELGLCVLPDRRVQGIRQRSRAVRERERHQCVEHALRCRSIAPGLLRADRRRDRSRCARSPLAGCAASTRAAKSLVV